MQAIMASSAREAELIGATTDNGEEQRLMEKAIQESMQENPNPDLMSYEQLNELGDKIGTVSRGFNEARLAKLRPTANFDYLEECPICIDKMEIACLIKKLKCNHVFHAECIDRCLMDSKKCPC